MPVERRTVTAARPVKTERTHEENQERAYIAASRRSDRSLEARIESARRASEIHKKRTGRALRVTEQDVVNEEMYEEEDDDLPTQYQRLNAHLHTTSVMFNKKLHDYIATQHGVRNMFMSQYQNPSMPPYNGGQFSPNNTTATFPQTSHSNWLNPAMLPPQQFNPASPQQSVTQQPQLFAGSQQQQQQQGFRQTPYHIPSRPNAHQRSLSIQLPQATPIFDPSSQSLSASATTPGEANRRLSLPPSAFHAQSPATQDQNTRSCLSNSPTERSANASVSPQTTSPTMGASPAQHDADMATSMPYSPAGYPFSSQVLNSNILSMSMPPESQQFIGSALDPNDPRTALFMAGSDNLPQPFTPTYTYNPNFAGKLTMPSTSGSMTLAPASGIKTEPVEATTSNLPGSLSDGFFTNEAFLTPGNTDYNAFFDFQGADYNQNTDEQGDGSNFVNWD